MPSSGPTIIFDKSTLQSLNADEAMWLDQFFTSNVTPLFFLEVLADLEKTARKGRTPEDVVGSLTSKTPDLHSMPNVHHLTLLAGELSGRGEFEMSFEKPVVAHGIPAMLGDKTGIIIKETSEEEALRRWQYKRFREFERLVAKAWRSQLRGLDLEVIYDDFQPIVAAGSRPKTLAEVKSKADSIIANMPDARLLKFGLDILGYKSSVLEKVRDRWDAAGRPPIPTFLPYFTYVLSVDLFFYVALAADLVSRERASNRIDIEYLYYLPFCTLFASNDKLHERTVPLFLKPHQTFVPGQTLKEELAKLDAHYSALPEEEKAQGIYYMAAYPPEDERFLVTRLWDKYWPYWRDIRDTRKKPEDLKMTEEQKAFVDQFKEAKPNPGLDVSFETAAYISSSRRVRIQQGKWRRFPPEVKPDIGEDEED